MLQSEKCREGILEGEISSLEACVFLSSKCFLNFLISFVLWSMYFVNIFCHSHFNTSLSCVDQKMFGFEVFITSNNKFSKCRNRKYFYCVVRLKWIHSAIFSVKPEENQRCSANVYQRKIHIRNFQLPHLHLRVKIGF